MLTKENIRKISRHVNILYVEDDLLLQSQIMIYLVKYFENIECVNDGKQALKLLENEKFDIVILDIKLPDISGIELAKIIKKKNKDVFIIITTIIKDIDTILQLINIGIERFLIKPFKLKDLFKILYTLSIQVYNAKRKAFLEKERLNELTKKQIILETLPFGIVLMDENNIKFVNKRFLEFFGLENSKVLSSKKFTEFLKNEEFKDLTNNEFIEILKQKPFVTVKSINNKSFMVEIEELENFNEYILIFMNIKIFEEKIEELKRQLYFSEYTKLPNVYQFKEKINNFKREEKELYFYLFSIGNYKLIKGFIGKKNAYMLLLRILQKIINDFKESEIYKQIYIFEFTFNKFVIVVSEDKLKEVENIIKKYKSYQTTIYAKVENDIKKVPVNIKILDKIQAFDKSMSEEQIIERIEDSFDEFI